MGKRLTVWYLAAFSKLTRRSMLIMSMWVVLSSTLGLYSATALMLGQSSTNNKTRSTVATVGDLNQQAMAQADQFWRKRYTRCGDDYVSSNYLVTQSGLTGGTYLGVVQYKNLRWWVQPTGSLSEADRLNGVQWRGITNLSYSSERWRPKGIRTWHEWQNGPMQPLEVVMAKRNDVWTIDQPHQDTRRPMSCQEINWNSVDMATASAAAKAAEARPHTTPSIAKKPCTLETSLKSPQNPATVSIRFHNDSPFTIKVNWLGLDGRRQLYATVEPNQSATVNSFVGHYWLVEDLSGRCEDIYYATVSGNLNIEQRTRGYGRPYDDP